MRRFRQWIKSPFPVEHEPEVTEAMAHRMRRIRSANICLANRGATRRERSNAKATLAQHGGTA